jgi:hypothetical protein
VSCQINKHVHKLEGETSDLKLAAAPALIQIQTTSFKLPHWHSELRAHNKQNKQTNIQGVAAAQGY